MNYTLGTKVRLHANPIYALAVQNAFIFTGSADLTVKQFNTETESLEHFTVRTSSACIAMHRFNSTLLLLGLLNGEFHAIDTQTKQEVFTHDFGGVGVFAITASTSLNHIYLGLADGRIAVLDASSFELLFFEYVAQDKIRKLLFCEKRSQLFYASKDGSIGCLDSITFEQMVAWNAHAMGVNSLVLAEGIGLISGGKEGYISLWDIDSSSLMRSFPAHRGAIYDLQILNNQLLSASRDRSIKVWKLPNFEPLQKLVEHQQSVNGIAQQNQHSFVSVSDDGTLVSWNRV